MGARNPFSSRAACFGIFRSKAPAWCIVQADQVAGSARMGPGKSWPRVVARDPLGQRGRFQPMASNSTSNSKVALGGITPPAPRAP